MTKWDQDLHVKAASVFIPVAFTAIHKDKERSVVRNLCVLMAAAFSDHQASVCIPKSSPSRPSRYLPTHILTLVRHRSDSHY